MYQICNQDINHYFLSLPLALEWMEKNEGSLSKVRTFPNSPLYKKAVAQENKRNVIQVELNDIPLFYFLTREKALQCCSTLKANKFIQIKEILCHEMSDCYQKAVFMEEVLDVRVSFRHSITQIP